MTLKLYRWIGLLCLFSLSACQHIEPQSSNDEWLTDETIFAQRQVDFESQRAWQYSAKVGVVTEQVREQANIVWDYSDQSNNVRLFGPLGVGQIKLEFDQYGVQLSDSKGILHQGFASQGVTAETLLTDITALPIPINALSYWLFVLPAPNSVYSYQLDDQGNLSSLKQLGWQIGFQNYRDYAGNVLPRKLTAVRNDGTQSITVRLVTKNWQWPSK